MKEIKFRAWHKNRECFVPIQAHFSFDTNGELYQTDYKPIELMQFTGLKDKNGKEIYEGDIVKANINNVVSIGKVVYIDDWAMFQTEFTIGNIGRYNCYEADEVIGNIYETPELLDKDKPMI